MSLVIYCEIHDFISMASLKVSVTTCFADVVKSIIWQNKRTANSVKPNRIANSQDEKDGNCFPNWEFVTST